MISILNRILKELFNHCPHATRWTGNTSLLLMKEGKLWVLDAKNGLEREAGDADKIAPKPAVKPSAFSKNKRPVH